MRRNWLISVVAAGLAACGADNGIDDATGGSGAAPTETVSADDGAFFPVSVSADDNAVIIELPPADEGGVSLRAIHTSGVTSGLGSNPVGLDRGFQDSGRVIAFRRIGKKVLIEEENWRYRASADNPLEKKAVLDSFARSLLWAGEVAEEKANGAYTVDISTFLTTDMLDLRGWLTQAGQGSFAFAADRSFADTESVLVFPENVELDAVVTLVSDKPGSEVIATAANGRSVTLTIHHSFIKLPDDGYKMREYDPRSGAIDVTYYDFSAPLEQQIVRKAARRYRLERVDPNAASGPVKKPIVFYIDSGAPEQVRNALVEGASWWAEAFEAAGFEDAYRVEVLPDDVHPFDARYNVVQWTHRQTRGWSYGGGVADPRTGEMIKGHVILGSQRVRQDRMIFEGLAGAAKSGTGAADDPVEIALARIRQLSAHEVGHALGFEHNFAASSDDRASVMDYPAPLVTLGREGGLDFSEAYGVGVGAWDHFTVKWLYTEFPERTDEPAGLDQIIREGYASGLRFVADVEGRSIGTGHPHGSVWDNGDDPVAMLDETMAVRKLALADFGLDAIKDNRDSSELRSVIVPIFLYHRYQVAAAAKLVGGYQFDYARKGDGREVGASVPDDQQRAALAALIRTLDPAALDLTDDTLNLLTPQVSSFASFASSETFKSDTGAMFDLMRAADAAGSVTIGALLHPQRLARLIENERRTSSALSVEEVLRAVETQLFRPHSGRTNDVARVLQARFVTTLIDVSAAKETPILVKARTNTYLKALSARLAPGLLEGASRDRTYREWLRGRITYHLDNPVEVETIQPDAVIPPGSPIGSAESCWHCDTTL